MSSHIYYGPWINFEHGPITGATLTLGDRSGALLTAFVATFVTLVGAQLFKVLVYVFHQTRSKEGKQDGLYHQQQVIFRNTTTPGAAAWNFLLQSWTWSGKAKLTIIRTIPWAFFCVAYMLLFAVAAVFSSEITKGPGSARLVIGDTCGYWEPTNLSSIASAEAFARYVANESLVASAYARSCYGGSYDELACSKFAVPSINYTAKTNAPCPFTDGMCTLGGKNSYELTAKIDSLHHLGINSRRQDRVEIQRISTCTPLSQDGFTEQVEGDGLLNGRKGDTLYQFNYGMTTLNNYTFQYNDHASLDGFGYYLDFQNRLAGPSTTFDPIPEIARKDADVTVIFLMPNGLIYTDPVDDPVFAAHQRLALGSSYDNADFFSPDNYVSTMGCIEQYSICNPNNGKCTPPAGINQVYIYLDSKDKPTIGLSEVQQSISTRLIRTMTTGSIEQILFALGSNSLAAKDVVTQNMLSQGLPKNQWQIEMQGWFNKGLADFQHKIVEYATGPDNVVTGSYIYKPWEDKDKAFKDAFGAFHKAMCYTQIIRDTTDTISFSILGMIILFSVGGIIIILSLFIDTLVGWYQKRFHVGEHARLSWLLDDKLQLHRSLNQELGHGQWDNNVEAIPTTVNYQPFSTLAEAQRRAVTGEKTHYQSPNVGYAQPAGYNPPTYQAPQEPQSPPVNNQRYSRVQTEEMFLPK